MAFNSLPLFPASRRRFLRSATAFGVAGLLAPLVAAYGEEKPTSVKVLNWQGYGTDETWAIEAFKKATGLEIIHDYFNSEAEMLYKLRASPGAYDVVLTNSAWNGVAAKENLIQPIDTGKITHFADLTPDFRDSSMLNADGKVFGVSWVWGITGIAYSTDVFASPPESIEELWNPARVKRVALRDDAVEAVSFAAIATGQDMNHPADLARVKEKLLALKPNIALLWSSEDEWNKQFEAKAFDIAAYWSGSALRSKTNFKLPVGFTVPKEGAIGWFDGLAVAKDAPNPEGAHLFIDYMVDPAFYVEWETKVGAPASANAKAMASLPDSDPAKPLYGDTAMIGRLQFMALLSDQERQAYSDLWTEVKTEFAK